jgi:hypothetical protein
VDDVSREFPRVAVLKFSMSDRRNDTVCYKKRICRSPPGLGTLACMGSPDHILVVDDDLGLRELLADTLPATVIGSLRWPTAGKCARFSQTTGSI